MQAYTSLQDLQVSIFREHRRFKTDGRPVLNAPLSDETARSERKRSNKSLSFGGSD
jgi:hypothetical protein